MSDENQNEGQNQEEEKSEVAKKLQAIKDVKALNKDSVWTIPQEILQEVVAGYTVADPQNIPKTPKLVEDLLAEIKRRYDYDPTLRDTLLLSVPKDLRYVREWMKKEGWEAAIWSKVRMDGLFTSSKRAEVIESLRQRAIDRSDVAAKIWLTLSGDYSEKSETADSKTVDTYREINKLLHGKKD